jgi:hypothetical protein
MQPGNWYQRMPQTDRRTVDELAEWLRPIDWQLFVTLTFPWNARSETADVKFKSLINSLERTMQTSVCYVAGKEARSKAGAVVPWHFHALLASLAPIPASLVKLCWMESVGRTPSDLQADDLVDVRPFNGQLQGIEYAVKQIRTEGEWFLNAVERFHPAIEKDQPRNHRYFRKKRRWDAQLAHAAQSAEPRGVLGTRV